MDNAWIEAARKMGGLATSVTIVQVLMSIAIVTVALMKWRELRARAAATRRFASTFTPALERGDVPAALAACRANGDSQLAVVLGAALRSAAPFLGSPQHGDLPASVAEVAADREQILVTGQLRRGLNILAAIGATATLMGLLGTVAGIFNSFAALARTGGGSVEVIAVGAGEALLTTALGLIVAIPALWLYTYFSTRIERLMSELDYGVQELIEWLMVRGAVAPPGAAPSAPIEVPVLAGV